MTNRLLPSLFQKIQIAGGPFFAEDLNASQFFQFTAPYTADHGLSILMKLDSNSKTNYYKRYTFFIDYVLNLDSNVWGVITACYVVACFLWLFIDRITGCCGPCKETARHHAKYACIVYTNSRLTLFKNTFQP